MFYKKTSSFLCAVSLLSLLSVGSLQAMELPEDDIKHGPVVSVQHLPAVISVETDQQVLEQLTRFGLAPEALSGLWDSFRNLMLKKGPLQPLALAANDPHYIAFGLWKAYQEQAYPQPTTQTSLPLRSMLSCLLTKEFSSIKKKLSPGEVYQLSSLIQINPYFTKLELFKAGVTDTHLSYMGLIPHLEELSLEENDITDRGVETLVKYPKLHTLNLAKNKITPIGVTLLSASPTLLHLNLYSNPIGDEGAEILSHNTVLTYLDLRGDETGAIVKIKDKGAIALAQNKTLKDLRLRYNEITDVGAEHFLNSHHLTRLELARNRISPNLVFFLEHLMPSNGFLNEGQTVLSSFLPSQLPHKDRVRILAIDGGGIRGLLPAYILNHVAQALSQKTGSFHFAQHIDLMAGTSTGGIITYGLTMPGPRARPKYTPQTLVDLYREKGHEIFPAPWNPLKFMVEATYDATGIERYLGEFFGETMTSECCCPTLVTSFDLKHNQPYLFDSLRAKVDTSSNFRLRDAGRATSAAPTYFPSAKVTNQLDELFEFVDGGIYANNPTLFALQRAYKLYPTAKEYIVYSLGTGETAKQNLSHLGNAGLVKWGVNIANVLMDNAADYTEKLLNAEIQRDPRIKYVRIQPILQESEAAMDNVRLENIENLLRVAERTVTEKHAVLEEMIAEFEKDFGQQ